MYLPQVINYYFNHISLESLFNLNAKHVYKELQGKKIVISKIIPQGKNAYCFT